MKHSKARRRSEQDSRIRRFNPSFRDFKLFLQQNPYRKFYMEDPWSCVAAVYSGKEITETYTGPPWFLDLQRRVNRGVWLGKDILAEMERLKPPHFEVHVTPRDPVEIPNRESLKPLPPWRAGNNCSWKCSPSPGPYFEGD